MWGRSTHGSTVNDVTGRDGYIMAKALCYAIAFIDSLPIEIRENFDRDDMVAILVETVPDGAKRELLARDVEAHTGILPDFTNWKIGG